MSPQRCIRRGVSGRVFAVALLVLGVGVNACVPPPLNLIVYKRAFYLTVTAAPDANRNSAIAVEVVVSYQKELIPQLLELDARKWFAARAQLLRDHPESLVVQRWEWVPGQEIPNQRVALRPKAKAAFIYASYVTPGDHRVQLALRDSRVALGRDAFTVTPLE